ncbi:hypothetical protein [Streptomyces globosus]|uniref:hypothetical protein n=1 Tax=Streptomyces globosus TaxID=68209 RepID=UPI0031DBD957
MSNPREAKTSIADRFAQVTSFQEPTEAEAACGVVRKFAKGGTDWRANGDVSRGPQGLVITRLEVRPYGDAGASVTSRMLRDVPVGAILDDVRYHLAVEELKGTPTVGPITSTVFTGQTPTRTADEIIAASSPAKAAPGRAALPDELMQAVAEGYIAESAPGKSRGAVKRLAVALGRPEATVSSWVVKARRDGWLGPGAAGREGAEPGPRLLQANAEQARKRFGKEA